MESISGRLAKLIIKYGSGNGNVMAWITFKVVYM